MKKRADDKAPRASAEVCVLDHARNPATNRSPAANRNTMYEYDATPLIGLHVIARHAAIVHPIVPYEGECGKVDDQEAIELPKLDELMATAAVVRCLMAPRLRGYEIRAMRKIMRLTLSDMAERMDSKTAPETVSRWESEAQLMGGYAEKVLRLLVCETLREKAPGVEYDGSMISRLRQVDPWRVNPDYELPPIELELMKVRQNGAVDNAWTAEAA